MYITFKGDKRVISFNDAECEFLERLCELFNSYGTSSLKDIQDILSTSYAMRIIPIFYKVSRNIDKNIVLDICERYKEQILNNDKVYLEFGLILTEYLRDYNKLKSAPDYIKAEVDKYELVNKFWYDTLKYKGPSEMYVYGSDINTRPYNIRPNINNSSIVW